MTKARENSDYTGLQGDLALKSPVASPVFTGNVGIGVVPEAWPSNGDFVGLQVGSGLSLYGRGAGDQDRAGMTANAYVDANDDRFEYIGTGHATHYKQSDGQHIFQVAPSGTADTAISFTTAMTIDNSGNVGIGAPSFNSSVRVYSKALNGASAFATSNTSGTGGYNAMSFYNNGASLSYCGAISVTGSTTSFSTSSDYRLKTDVQPMTGAADRVKLLKPCNFEWIVDGTRVDGFLAHEAQEVVPESVVGTKDAMRDEEYEVTPATDTEAAVMGTRSVPDLQGIDQSKLVPLLTATIQELIARIEALEGE